MSKLSSNLLPVLIYWNVILIFVFVYIYFQELIHIFQLWNFTSSLVPISYFQKLVVWCCSFCSLSEPAVKNESRTEQTIYTNERGRHFGSIADMTGEYMCLLEKTRWCCGVQKRVSCVVLIIMFVYVELNIS